jgi:hypothetical protein
MTNSEKGRVKRSARGSAKGSLVKVSRTPPPPTHQSPSRLAKTKATASINCLYTPRPMVPVAEVVAMPPSSPLATSHSTSARAPLTVGSNKDSDDDNNSSESNQLSEICCERIAGRKTTGLFNFGKDLGSGDSSDVGDVGEGSDDELQLLDDDELPTDAEVVCILFTNT